MNHDLRKLVRSYDPHLHQIRNWPSYVKLKKLGEAVTIRVPMTDDWISVYINLFFLDLVNESSLLADLFLREARTRTRNNSPEEGRIDWHPRIESS